MRRKCCRRMFFSTENWTPPALPCLITQVVLALMAQKPGDISFFVLAEKWQKKAKKQTNIQTEFNKHCCQMELMAVNKQVRRAVGSVPSPSTNSNQLNIPQNQIRKPPLLFAKQPVAPTLHIWGKWCNTFVFRWFWLYKLILIYNNSVNSFQ